MIDLYRCAVCAAVSRKGQPRLVYTIYREVPNRSNREAIANGRTRLEICREVPVCSACQKKLNNGTSLFQLVGEKQQSACEELNVPLPIPVPKPAPVAKPIKFGR